jgi:hypothetical protein
VGKSKPLFRRSKRMRKENGYLMSYSAGLSGLSFGGRPFPRTSRIVSSAESSYSGDLVFGLIPATIRRCRTVVGFISRAKAISSTVKPVIMYLSENITYLLIFFKIFSKRY